MARVDSKGRVTIPKEVRESLGIDEGSHVEIRTEDGRVVVEPEREPEEILDEMESILENVERKKPKEGRDAIAEEHVKKVRLQAEGNSG